MDSFSSQPCRLVCGDSITVQEIRLVVINCAKQGRKQKKQCTRQVCDALRANYEPAEIAVRPALS